MEILIRHVLAIDLLYGLPAFAALQTPRLSALVDLTLCRDRLYWLHGTGIIPSW
jgi:hypothetical protein